MSRSPEQVRPGSTSAEQAEYSAEERRLLLDLAHQSILGWFEGKEPRLAPIPEHLNEPRGAFTTIYLHGDLRGCVGYVQAIAPLYRTVILTARGAAFEDGRFNPVSNREARELTVSLSILSPLVEVDPEEVQVGRHGVMITFGEHRGLLLPQVATEHDWDRETFLGQTCRKAGLVPDAWRRGATVHVFSAEAFGDS